MIKLKKMIASLLACALLAGLCACGGAQDQPEEKKDMGEGFYAVDTENSDLVVEEANFTLPASPTETEGLFTPVALISDGCVLQRNAVNCIFGTTQEKSVAVRIAGSTFYGTVHNGRFEVYLSAREEGGPYELEIIGLTGKTTIKNVWFGEVFLLSGQSNMAWTMGSNMNGDLGNHTGRYVPTPQTDPDTYLSYVSDSKERNEEIKNYVLDQLDESTNDHLSIFKIAVQSSSSPVYNQTEPAENVVGAWRTSDFESMYDFFAVGCSFGLTMQSLVNVPVGLVGAALGATFVPTWTPEDIYASSKESFAYGGDLSSDACNRAGRCYGQYISPIAGYKFRCAVWYQGEGQPSRYAESMLKLIEGWRRDFGYELPFLIVQLPRYGENDILPDQYASMGLNMPSISLTPFQIREEQKKITEQATKCTYSVNVDLGDYDELHPYDKKPVGMRAAYKVMEYFYGTQGIWSGARLDRAVLEGSKVKLYFKNVGGGIVVKNNGINLEVAGSDSVYYPATIEKTESDCVIIGCSEVSAPVSVRYGANNYPRIDRNDVSLYMSLFTSEGFPVEQFIASLA